MQLRVLPCGAAEKAAAVVIVVLVAGAAVVGTAVALGRVWGAMTTEGHPGDGGLLPQSPAPASGRRCAVQPAAFAALVLLATLAAQVAAHRGSR